jgi:adenylylsulfate kinase-like enzyme
VFVDLPARGVRAPRPQGPVPEARAGRIAEFTGISAPYEPPVAPELRIPTAEQDLASSVAAVLELLQRRGIIR